MCPLMLGSLRLLSLPEIRAAFPEGTAPSLETLRRLIRAGKLPGRRFGRSWWVSDRALAAYLEGANIEKEPAAAPSHPVLLV